MNYIHVNNLEKYLPGYKDRILSWFKLYFRDSIDEKTKVRMKNFFDNPDIEQLDEIDRYRLISLIAKEAELGRPVPLDEKRLITMGWNTKKRSKDLTISLLQGKFISCNKEVGNTCNVDKDKEEDKDKDKEEDKEENYSKMTIEYSIAQSMYDYLLKLNSNFKLPNLNKWAKEIELMIKSDNRTQEQIDYILKWLYTDSDSQAIFWRKNILSPEKLRKQFDRLVIILKDLNSNTGVEEHAGIKQWLSKQTDIEQSNFRS